MSRGDFIHEGHEGARRVLSESGFAGCEDFEEGLVVVGGDWGKGILDSSLRSE